MAVTPIDFHSYCEVPVQLAGVPDFVMQFVGISAADFNFNAEGRALVFEALARRGCRTFRGLEIGTAKPINLYGHSGRPR